MMIYGILSEILSDKLAFIFTNFNVDLKLILRNNLEIMIEYL